MASALRSAGRQCRNQNRIFWRTPIAAFFTLAFPLMFLLLLATLFDTVPGSDGSDVDAIQFYAPGLAVFAAASATFTNLAINLSMLRDEGILKRWRGTPIRPASYMGGAVLSALWIAVLANGLMLAVGFAFFGLEAEAAKLPASATAFVIGSLSFAALGVAMSALVKSGRNAPAAAQAFILPMAFVSDVFISSADAPQVVQVVGDVLPLKPFTIAFRAAFDPEVAAPGFAWDRLAVVAAWGVVAATIALTRFTWEPAPAGSSTRAGRRRRAAA